MVSNFTNSSHSSLSGAISSGNVGFSEPDTANLTSTSSNASSPKADLSEDMPQEHRKPLYLIIVLKSPTSTSTRTITLLGPGTSYQFSDFSVTAPGLDH